MPGVREAFVIGKSVFDGIKKYGGLAMDVFDQLSKDSDKWEKRILNAANALGGSWVEMQDIAFQTGRSMAMSREMAMRYDRQLMQTTKELARQYGITAKEIAEFQKTYAEATGRNIMLSKEQTKAMAAMQKIAGENAGTIIDEFDKVGIGIERATAYTGKLQERAKALGVSPAKATKMMADNIKLAASYSFRNGVADIEKMALRASSMRMDMNAVMGAAEKFMNIEDAISKSANIQMLGGSFAQQFSNPMGAMYEAMADPQQFQERLLRTVQGKGRYDQKTGQVTFDPVTMMQLREMAGQLGMSVDQLTNPAIAETQDKRIEEEMRAAGKWEQFSEVEQEAIKNLSRTNVDEATGKHQITYTDVNGELQTKAIENLTHEELQIAQDRQMDEKGLFSDVQDIKDILERTLGRARGTTSTKENIQGLKSEWDAFKAQIQNTYMGMVSGWANGQSFQPWDLLKKVSYYPGRVDAFTHGTEGFGNFNGGFFDKLRNMWGGQYAFAEGGIVKPVPHASMGAIIPGDSYSGDKTPVMANAGEMVLNKGEQKGLFDLLKSVATTGLMMYGGNKLGRRFGLRGIGTDMALNNLFSGGDMGIGGMIGSGLGSVMGRRMMMGGMMPMGRMPMGMGINPMGAGMLTLMNPTVMMNGQTVMNGSIGDGSLVEQLEDVADAAADVTRNTRSFSMRLRDLSKQDTFLGKRARGFRKFKVASGRFFNRGRVGIRHGLSVGKSKILSSNLYRRLDSYKDTARYNLKYGRLGEFYQTKFKPGYSSFRSNVSDLFNTGSKAQASKAASRMAQGVTETTKAVSKVGKVGKLMSGVGKAGKLLGRAAGPLATVMAVGGAISDISSASSQYDAKVSEIETSEMSQLDKAKAKDKAAKEKNAGIGSGVGGAVGAAAGAALGSMLGPLGTIAGGWLGQKAGSFIGKGIGGLFGGGNEKKFKKEQEKLFEDKAKSSDDVVKLLKSIDNKLSAISGKSIGLKGKNLAKPTIKSIFGTVGGATGAALGSLLGPAGMIAGKVIGSKVGDSVKSLPIQGNFMKVEPSKGSESSVNKPIKLDKTTINLNVSGTIKLEGGGKGADLDISKLLDTPEFKRQLTDIITKRVNENSNSGKRNMESERNNMASQYNKSGK